MPIIAEITGVGSNNVLLRRLSYLADSATVTRRHEDAKGSRALREIDGVLKEKEK